MWWCALGKEHPLARFRFRHLQLIAEVERTGILSRAAEALNLTQPALSKALEKVESMLGFEIFYWGTRGLQTRAEGSVLVHGAQLLLRELVHVQAEAETAGSDGGLAAVLRLGASGYLAVGLIPLVVARLTSRVPLLAVWLHEETLPRLFESLLAGDPDALITLYNHDVMAGTAGRDIRFERISEEGCAVIAPSGHRMTRARSVSWKMLGEAPWVLTRKPSLARVFLEDSFCRHGLIPPVPTCEIYGPVTAARIIAGNVGLSGVPETTAKEGLQTKAVSLVKLQIPQSTATLGLVSRTASADHPRLFLLRQALPVGEWIR